MFKNIKGYLIIFYFNLLFYFLTNDISGNLNILGRLLYFWPVEVYYGYLSVFKIIQPITYQFIHADIPHLISNMLLFLIISPRIEEKIGKIKFLIYYLFSGIMAGYITLFLSPLNTYLLGASASIFSLLGVYFYFNLGGKLFNFIDTRILILLILIEQVLLLGVNSDISNISHLIGFLIGFLIYNLEKYDNKEIIT